MSLDVRLHSYFVAEPSGEQASAYRAVAPALVGQFPHEPLIFLRVGVIAGWRFTLVSEASRVMAYRAR